MSPVTGLKPAKGGDGDARTTTENVPGQTRVKTLGQCFGVVVRSRGLGGNILAGLRSIIGGEIHEYNPAPRGDAPARPSTAWVTNATAMGANAVVMMRFDSSEIGQFMSEIVAYGTAVVLEPEPSPCCVKSSSLSAARRSSHRSPRFCSDNRDGAIVFLVYSVLVVLALIYERDALQAGVGRAAHGCRLDAHRRALRRSGQRPDGDRLFAHRNGRARLRGGQEAKS